MKITRFISILILLAIAGNSGAQDLKGETVHIRLNNLPKVEVVEEQDLTGPGITIVSPPLNESNYYHSDTVQIDIIGKVSDKNGISILSIDSKISPYSSSGVFTTPLTLNPGYNTIRILAMDKKDNLNEHYMVIEYTPPEKTLADIINENSTYYGLIIGMDKYRDPKLQDLNNPVRDCRKLRNTIIDLYTFNEDNLILLENATRKEIIRSLDELAQRVSPEDNLLIYYAGHGWWDENSENGYWLPSDANHDEKSNWIRNSAIVDYLKEIKSKHTLLIADACFGGSIFKSRSVNLNQDKAFEKLYELPSRKAMTSGTLTEVPDRSSFTKYLIERLINNKSQYLSSEQLFSSFRIAVINNSDAVPQYGDISNVGDQGGDFIFLSKD